MKKHPIHYTKEELEKIEGKLVEIDVGPHHSEQIDKTILCQFLHANIGRDNLPTLLYFKPPGAVNSEFWFDIYQIRDIRVK